MKNIYKKKRKSFHLFNNKNKISNVSKKKAVLFKNTMYNRKEIILFSLSGIIKFKKMNTINKSFNFVGNISRSSVRFTGDLKYPGIFIF